MRWSLPGLVPESRAKRRPSVPYCDGDRAGRRRCRATSTSSGRRARARGRGGRRCRRAWRPRPVLHVVERQHDHAGDPEEDDVVAGLHHLRRVEARQVVGLLRPAERGVRPEARGEPGVEGVLVLADVRGLPQPRSGGGLDGHGQVLAGVAVPDGDAVAPPDLAADAPVADVLHPVQVDALEALRDEAISAAVTASIGRLRRASSRPPTTAARSAARRWCRCAGSGRRRACTARSFSRRPAASRSSTTFGAPRSGRGRGTGRSAR
jgi:hypothetical protein